VEKKGRSIEEVNDNERITGLGLLVAVTGHLNNLHKELQSKDKLIAERYDNIKALEVKTQLCETQLKLHNFVHFPHLKSLDTTLFKNIPSPYFCLIRIPELQNYGRRIFVLCLTFTGRHSEGFRRYANGIKRRI
jgi:hypothetical protein